MRHHSNTFSLLILASLVACGGKTNDASLFEGAGGSADNGGSSGSGGSEEPGVGGSGPAGSGGSNAGSAGEGGSNAGSAGEGGSNAGSAGEGGSNAGSAGEGGSNAGSAGEGGSDAGSAGSGPNELTCDDGLNACGDTCVDTSSNFNHCGACNNACPIGLTCHAGSCSCPDSLTTCDGACVDTSSDNNNCGSCGSVCTTTCTNGACPSILDVAIGADFACALFNDGRVKCVGGTTPPGAAITLASLGTLSAMPLVDSGGAVTQLSAGLHHVCARLNTGKVVCWGGNESGQLGQGNTASVGFTQTPASSGNVSLGVDKVRKVVAGAQHTCVLLESGLVRCWGGNQYGQLGYGHTNTIGDDETPINQGYVKLSGKPIDITAGADHTCVLLEGEMVQCWGRNHVGQLGYGNTNNIGDNEIPSAAGFVEAGSVAELVAGTNHTCVRRSSGKIRCWGSNAAGELGYEHNDNIGDNEKPSNAGDAVLAGNATQLSAGNQFTCALLNTQKVQCWGSSENKALGYFSSFPVKANQTVEVPWLEGIKRIFAGQSSSCALTQTNQLKCWGRNQNAQLGYGFANETGMVSQEDFFVPAY